MATETHSKQVPAGVGQQPPGYYAAHGSGMNPTWSPYSAASGSADFNPGTGTYPQHLPVTQTVPSPNTSVMVTQPHLGGGVNRCVEEPISTTCALVMSTLSAILCGFWCGAVAIVLAWKARMQVLDKKYEHAAHSLKIVWLFLFLAVLFGIAIWAMAGIYLYYIAAYVYYYG
ncbi:uncharacterized protein [Littorina saxatilis]|uniref:Transmembrane protein n=1 Tax=Littorina saxatilis TaxID=31220 RepID=A0AAN9C019_9CAEN